MASSPHPIPPPVKPESFSQLGPGKPARSKIIAKPSSAPAEITSPVSQRAVLATSRKRGSSIPSRKIEAGLFGCWKASTVLPENQPPRPLDLSNAHLGRWLEGFCPPTTGPIGHQTDPFRLNVAGKSNPAWRKTLTPPEKEGYFRNLKRFVCPELAPGLLVGSEL